MPIFWRGQLIGDHYARHVVGSSRVVVEGIEMSPVLNSTDSLRIVDNGAVASTIQQRPTPATFSAVDNVAPGEQPRFVALQPGNHWHEDFYGVPGLSFLQSPAGQAAGQKYTSNRFGGSVTGPLLSHSTHFMAQYLGQRESVERRLEGYVPSASFSTEVQKAEPHLDSILGAYPKEHSASHSSTTVYDSTGSQTASSDIGMLRLDHTFSARHGLAPDTVFGRFNQYVLRRDPCSPIRRTGLPARYLHRAYPPLRGHRRLVSPVHAQPHSEPPRSMAPQ
jgi:hypothetical protein